MTVATASSHQSLEGPSVGPIRQQDRMAQLIGETAGKTYEVLRGHYARNGLEYAIEHYGRDEVTAYAVGWLMGEGYMPAEYLNTKITPRVEKPTGQELTDIRHEMDTAFSSESSIVPYAQATYDARAKAISYGMRRRIASKKAGLTDEDLWIGGKAGEILEKMFGHIQPMPYDRLASKTVRDVGIGDEQLTDSEHFLAAASVGWLAAEGKVVVSGGKKGYGVQLNMGQDRLDSQTHVIRFEAERMSGRLSEGKEVAVEEAGAERFLSYAAVGYLARQDKLGFVERDGRVFIASKPAK